MLKKLLALLCVLCLLAPCVLCEESDEMTNEELTQLLWEIYQS